MIETNLIPCLQSCEAKMGEIHVIMVSRYPEFYIVSDPTAPNHRSIFIEMELFILGNLRICTFKCCISARKRCLLRRLVQIHTDPKINKQSCSRGWGMPLKMILIVRRKQMSYSLLESCMLPACISIRNIFHEHQEPAIPKREN